MTRLYEALPPPLLRTLIHPRVLCAQDSIRRTLKQNLRNAGLSGDRDAVASARAAMVAFYRGEAVTLRQAPAPVPGALYTYVAGHGYVLVGGGGVAAAASAVPPEVSGGGLQQQLPTTTAYAASASAALQPMDAAGGGREHRPLSQLRTVMRSGATYVANLLNPQRGYYAEVDTVEPERGAGPAFVSQQQQQQQPASGSASMYAGSIPPSAVTVGYPFSYLHPGAAGPQV